MQGNVYIRQQIKQMNRKNNPTQWPQHPIHITVQDIDNTAAFRTSQLNLGPHGSALFTQDQPKWTFPLTLQKLQPYLMTIHSTLIKNLKRKLLQRQLTTQEQQLIECSRHNKHLQQFISGILAIETCVHELTKQHTTTVVSFMKATNLLLINYKLLYAEYIELKNTVRTSESLTNFEHTQSDGFMKFFDSLKFLALVIKNAFMEGEEQPEQLKDEQNSAISLRDSWRYELRKLQDLMSFQSILNMDKSSILNHSHKIIDQKLVSMHNQQQEIIISQLQKQNNFLRWQVFSKDNTITEYQESIYNVDLSRYRQNEEREDYWARRVKFNANGNCSNHNVNNYSQLLNDGSGISHCHQKSQLNIIEVKILEPEEGQDGREKILELEEAHDEREEWGRHLNILSRKMEELEVENKTLRDKLKAVKEGHMHKMNDGDQYQGRQQMHGNNQQNTHSFNNIQVDPTTFDNQKFPHKKERKYSQKQSQCSNHTESDRFQLEKQRLDILLNEISQMKTMILELEEKQVANRQVVNEKNALISGLEKELYEKQVIVVEYSRTHRQAEDRITQMQHTINTLEEQISALTTQLLEKSQQLQLKSHQLNTQSQQILKLSTISQQLQGKTQQLQQKTRQLQGKKQQLSQRKQQLQARQRQLEHITQKNNSLTQSIQLKQNQILTLTNDINSMNQQFVKQMEKYNTVFYKISQELSTSLENADSLQIDNKRLLDKNKKLQEDNVKKQAVIVDLQTRLACGHNNQFTSTFGSANNANPYLSNYNGRLSERRLSKLSNDNIVMIRNGMNNQISNVEHPQHVFSREHDKVVRKSSKTPLKQFQRPNELNGVSHINKIHQDKHIEEPKIYKDKINPLNNCLHHRLTNRLDQPQQIQPPTIHNHYHHHINKQPVTPSKRPSQLKREQNQTQQRSSKSPANVRDISRKKITIKVEGNKLVNQIVQTKPLINHGTTRIRDQKIDRKNTLLPRAHKLINNKENSQGSPFKEVDKETILRGVSNPNQIQYS